MSTREIHIHADQGNPFVFDGHQQPSQPIDRYHSRMTSQSRDQFRIKGRFGFRSPGWGGQVDVRLYRGLHPNLYGFTKASNHQRDPQEHADGNGQGRDGEGSGLQSRRQTLEAVPQSKSTRFDPATDLLDQERREKREGHQNRYRQHEAGRLPAVPQKPEP